MRQRMGEDRAGRRQQALVPGESFTHNGVTVSLVPAGHVLGSAQIVLEWRGSRVVVSGDYKRRRDPTCAPFEPVECDVFVTEATFGLPVFRHPPADVEIARLLESVRLFPDRAHLIGVYALGKCQRVIKLLREAGWDRPIHLHGGLVALSELYETLGVALGPLVQVPTPAKRGAGGMLAGEIVSPPPAPRRRPGCGASPSPWSAPPPAGCACASAHGARASSCRSSSPTIATGTSCCRPQTTSARRRSG
jgi:putative mRNA 3-end processing factor